MCTTVLLSIPGPGDSSPVNSSLLVYRPLQNRANGIPLNTIGYHSVSFSTIGLFNGISVVLRVTLSGNLKYHSIPLTGTKNPKYHSNVLVFPLFIIIMFTFLLCSDNHIRAATDGPFHKDRELLREIYHETRSVVKSNEFFLKHAYVHCHITNDNISLACHGVIKNHH